MAAATAVAAEGAATRRGRELILLRSAAFNAFFLLTTFVISAAATAVRFRNPDRVLIYAMAWARVVLWGLRTICRIGVEVTGSENLPTGPAVIASAHQSAFDTVVWFTLVPRCCYVLKKELLAIPLFGGLLIPSGMIAIDRSSGPSALRSLLKGAARAKREARQIVIFPEGTRVREGETLPLQPGVAALATRSGLQVIPVATNSGRYWGRRAFRKHPGTIRIHVRPPLAADLSRDELMRQLSEGMRLPAVDNSVG
jgi:1-acyl-sn-glycerol-3-phosphate acyltransferase